MVIQDPEIVNRFCFSVFVVYHYKFKEMLLVHHCGYDHHQSEIKNIEMELDDDKNPELIDEMRFKALDTINDGCIDTLSFDLENTKLPPKGTGIVATVEYTQDLKEPIKKKVSRVIYTLTLLLVLSNFILSSLLVEDPLFWL